MPVSFMQRGDSIFPTFLRKGLAFEDLAHDGHLEWMQDEVQK